MPIAWHTEQGSIHAKRNAVDEAGKCAVFLDSMSVTVPENSKSCKMNHFSRLTSNLLSTSKSYTLLCTHEIF